MCGILGVIDKKGIDGGLLPLMRELDVNRKWGFNIPISEWLMGSLFSELKERLLEDTDRYFRKDYVERLLTEHKSGVDHSGRLFTLLIFSLWKREGR